VEEARTLFNKNRGLSDPEEIRKKILEGETRLALAHHYKIPYPKYETR